MDIESNFLKKYNILKWDEFTVLNNGRISVNEKLSKKVITKQELLFHVREELNLLNTCKKKIQDNLNISVEVKTQILFRMCKRIIDLFDHIHVLFTIEEDLLSYYINFCQDHSSYINAEKLDILLEAVSKANNKNIWIQLLKLHFDLKNLDKLMKVFREGVRLLKEDSLPLWKILILHLQDKNPNMAKQLFEEGSNISYENISLEIRPRYLKWWNHYKGIVASRELFNKLKDLQPVCYKLYLMMISIESVQDDFEFDTARKLFDEICELVGRSNARVWIHYIRFENSVGNKVFKARISNKALFRLERENKDIVMAECRKLERDAWIALSKEVIIIDD